MTDLYVPVTPIPDQEHSTEMPPTNNDDCHMTHVKMSRLSRPIQWGEQGPEGPQGPWTDQAIDKSYTIDSIDTL